MVNGGNMKAIIPAIDISGGRCVRLSQGNFDTKKVYSTDPVELAEEYFSIGAKRLHVVDLDAAFKRGNNRSIISEICKVTPPNCIVEVGGGIREEKDVKALINMGVHRLCLGTILVRDLFEVIHWTKKYGDMFIGSLDIKDGELQVAGWQQEGGINAEAFLEQIKNINLCSIEYTNVTKDGMLSGPDIEYAKTVADKSSAPVVISGGIGSLEDVEKVMNTKYENIVGVILGKSVFEGLVDLAEAFKKFPSPDCSAW